MLELKVGGRVSKARFGSNEDPDLRECLEFLAKQSGERSRAARQKANDATLEET